MNHDYSIQCDESPIPDRVTVTISDGSGNVLEWVVAWPSLHETCQVANFRDHGAVGDGVTDDTAAVVAAIAALSAGADEPVIVSR